MALEEILFLVGGVPITYGRLFASLRAITGPPERTTDDGWLPCFAATAEAELSRLEGRSDPKLWATAARHWEQLQVVRMCVYTRFRQTEALLAARAPRSRVEPVLQVAHRTAVTLGNRPLQKELELLAQRGRLRLAEQIDTIPTSDEPPSPAASLGLTRREADVLTLLAAGRTNRQIGQRLYITEKTASVHVSRILAKLGVASRGEAAAIAHRLGVRGHVGD